MEINRKKALLKRELERNKGVLRLAPAWVPRSFLMPGGRLKLDPRDLYALGAHRGGIDERWLASTTRAENGPDTPDDEGLNYIVVEEGHETLRILLKEAIELAGDLIIGKAAMEQHRGWAVLTKFFDNLGPIPHHMHQMDEHAAHVGKIGKPEAYYFPVQLNSKENLFPYTFFGLEPGTTRNDVIRCLERWNEGDNGILYHSKAAKLKPGTGWSVPPGILHAPGSLVTYEPQKNCDIYGMFQSMVDGRSVPWSLLVKDVPEDKHHDLDYIVGMLDWEANVDPHFAENRYCPPKPVKDIQAMAEEGYGENWVVYGTDDYCSKELTVLPGRTVTIRDEAAYGLIMLQGNGAIQDCPLETPALIRFGELTTDEYFVSADAARQGVVIHNRSRYEPIVMLKHFGPKTKWEKGERAGAG